MWDTLAESIVIRNIRRSGEFTVSLSAVFFYPHFQRPQPVSTVPDTAHSLPYPCLLPGRRRNPPFSLRTAASCARSGNPG